MTKVQKEILADFEVFGFTKSTSTRRNSIIHCLEKEGLIKDLHYEHTQFEGRRKIYTYSATVA